MLKRELRTTQADIGGSQVSRNVQDSDSTGTESIYPREKSTESSSVGSKKDSTSAEGVKVVLSGKKRQVIKTTHDMELKAVPKSTAEKKPKDDSKRGKGLVQDVMDTEAAEETAMAMPKQANLASEAKLIKNQPVVHETGFTCTFCHRFNEWIDKDAVDELLFRCFKPGEIDLMK